MLNSGESEYYAALLALKRKDYSSASEHFKKAAPFFEHDREFRLFHESTSLMVAVKQELDRRRQEDSLEIEEVFSNG
jgi:hypothetical protein